MAIKNQKLVVCDNPKCDASEVTSTMSLRQFQSDLRSKGWSIGRKLIYCPQCAAGPARRLGRSSEKKVAKSVIPTTADVRKILCNTWGEFTICLSAAADNAEIKDLITPRYLDGDILYVREGWIPAMITDTYYEGRENESSETYAGLLYRADEEGFFPNRPSDHDPEFWLSKITRNGKWRSAATMPREAVRLFLTVKNTRFAKIHNGKFFYQECIESASKFEWNDLPWTEVITVERCDGPENFE